MSTKSKEYMALLLGFQVIIHFLDKKGVIEKEEMGSAFSVYAEELKNGELTSDPIFYETLQHMAKICSPKKKGSPVNLTLISNSDKVTEPDK